MTNGTINFDFQIIVRKTLISTPDDQPKGCLSLLALIHVNVITRSYFTRISERSSRYLTQRNFVNFFNSPSLYESKWIEFTRYWDIGKTRRKVKKKKIGKHRGEYRWTWSDEVDGYLLSTYEYRSALLLT